VFGALRVEDGNSLTFTSRSRNSEGYIKLLRKIERAIPNGIIHVIADNLKTHKSVLVREWLEKHPRIEQAFIPKEAAWLNLIEAWWRMFRRQALAGVDFADSYEIDQARRVATRQLNRKASPWGCGDDHPNRRGIGGALLCTVFEERSTNLLHRWKHKLCCADCLCGVPA